MASRILAIQANRPRIQLGRTVQTDQLVDYMASRTGLNTGEVLLVAYELHDALEYYLSLGQPVKLDGVGTFTPDLRSDGTFIVHYRPDADLKRKLNAREAFHGRLLNRKNLGKSAAQLAAQWNAQHPDDPVTPG